VNAPKRSIGAPYDPEPPIDSADFRRQCYEAEKQHPFDPRTWMFSIDITGKPSAELKPWLVQVVPEMPCYFCAICTTRFYVVLPALSVPDPLPTAPVEVHAQLFDDIATAKSWITRDMKLREMPTAGKVM
jgi:hypothetical protein